MIGLVVQARRGSTRFPDKALAPLYERPSLEWVFLRLSGLLKDLIGVLVTSDRPHDFVLAKMAHDYGFEVVRGSEKDVLSRFAAAIKFFGLSTVIRVTGDCPLIDPHLVKKALSAWQKTQPDCLRVTGIIDGFDVTIFRAEAILEAHHKASMPSEREHVAPYIYRKKAFIKKKFPYGDRDLSRYHLSLDYPEDLDLLERIFQAFGGRTDFTYEEVVELLEKNEDLRQMALRHLPNEGFLKSLEEDREFLKKEVRKKRLKLEKTEEHFQRASKVIPLASQTYSKSYYLFSRRASPLFVKEAKGCTLVDLDGNRYTDYGLALGACLLGYAFEPVNKAVEEQIKKGVVYSLPHLLEVEVAERLCEFIPGAEMVRFGKNGSDVTAAAVRLARAYTGREMVLCCGYHGWQDWYIGATTKNAGVPEAVKKLTFSFPYNDLPALEQIFKEKPGHIACVIMEPVILEEPGQGYLEEVRKLCTREGALLIFDEVMTGFRFGLSGAQGRYGVMPDLSCFGKAMGNGFPISALVGRREIMQLLEHEVFFSFTFGGETASLAAARATLDYLQTYEIPELLWHRGKWFIEALQGLIKKWELADILEIKGFPTRFVFSFKGENSSVIKTFIQQECVKRGQLFTGGFNISLPHTETIMKKTLETLEEVFFLLRYALEYGFLDDLIEGDSLREVFQVRTI